MNGQVSRSFVRRGLPQMVLLLATVLLVSPAAAEQRTRIVVLTAFEEAHRLGAQHA